MYKNAGLDTGNQARGVIRKQDKVIVIDDDNDDVIWDLVWEVVVNKDSVDHFSVSREDIFPGQEMVDPEKKDQLPDKGETLGRGKQQVTLRMLFSSKMKGKTHGSNATTGVGFP